RYGWVGGTGTSAYVHPDGTVAVLLTQVGLADPAIELLQAFWRASAE
ncbi:MAG: serine hydrolase, partial [Actinobacteria bacterium]|nr:serine hydrolase [Actinomycetota bacterium]